MKYAWQKIDKGTWFFGEKVRGIVREPFSIVWLDDGMWQWSVNSPGSGATKGRACKLVEAIGEAEKRLGKLISQDTMGKL